MTCGVVHPRAVASCRQIPALASSRWCAPIRTQVKPCISIKPSTLDILCEAQGVSHLQPVAELLVPCIELIGAALDGTDGLHRQHLQCVRGIPLDNVIYFIFSPCHFIRLHLTRTCVVSGILGIAAVSCWLSHVAILSSSAWKLVGPKICLAS